MKTHYVIWGKPPGEKYEVLLLEKVQGEDIFKMEDAKFYKRVLEEKHHCTDVRISKIDYTKPIDWRGIFK